MMMDIDITEKSNARKLTEEIYNMYTDGLRLPTNTPQSIARFNAQVAYEEEYKENNRVCRADGSGLSVFKGIDSTMLTGVHKKQLSSMLKHQFYDYNFMLEMRCMINTIIDIKDGDEESERSRIHSFIADPKRFGAPSAYSYAMRTDLNTGDDYGKEDRKHDTFQGDMLVVKCPREPSSAKELIHELCIGIRLAGLREYGCCNFAMVYDAWNCSAPVVDDSQVIQKDPKTGRVKKVPSKTNNEVLNWCMATENPVSYVGYELIHGAQSMNDIVRDFSPDIHLKMAQYLMQMSHAENMAERYAGFQHYDAHGGNVLLRPYSLYTKDKVTGEITTLDIIEPFFMYYNFNDEDFYIPTPGYIVTYIDYGMSRCIMEDGTIIGKLDASGQNMNTGIANPDCGNVLGDIYKTICAILYQSSEIRNDPLTLFLANILNGFFYRDNPFDWDTIKQAMADQLPIVYLLQPPLIEKMGLNITMFINYLREYTLKTYGFELMYSNPPEGSRIFGYHAHFEKFDEIKKEIGLSIPEIPTLFDLSTAISMESPNLDKIKNNVVKHIGEIIANERVGINSLVNAKQPSAFFHLDPKRYMVEKEKEQASRSIESVAVLASNCYEIMEKLKVYRNCRSLLKNDDLDELVSECQYRFTKDSQYIEKIKSQLMLNFSIIIDAMKEPRTDYTTKEALDKYPDPLFNLYDKYDKTIAALRRMSITL